MEAAGEADELDLLGVEAHAPRRRGRRARRPRRSGCRCRRRARRRHARGSRRRAGARRGRGPRRAGEARRVSRRRGGRRARGSFPAPWPGRGRCRRRARAQLRSTPCCGYVAMPADMLSDLADLDLRLRHALDDRARDREAFVLVPAREEERELVAAEPERLAVLTQPGGDLREDLVADRVPVAVVDLLEVVDVEQAEREREAFAPGPRPGRARAARGSGGGCRGR